MAVSWRNLVLALVTASGFCALIPSCADNNMSIFIRQFQANQAPDCTLTSDPTALAVFGGTVDLGLTNTYVAFPLIGNQLIARGDQKQSKAEPNRVAIQGAEVTLKQLDDSNIVDPFSVLATGTVDPAPATDPTYGVTSVQLLPPALAPQLIAALGLKNSGASASIKASLKVFGQTLGGKNVETGVVDFPLTVCIGCTVSVPRDAVSPTGGPRNCDAPLATATASTKSFCAIGQDTPVDCRQCVGTKASCRPCSTTDDCVGLTSTFNSAIPATCNVTAGFCQ
jgi:hypothetical protein